MDEFRCAMRQTMGSNVSDPELDKIFMKVSLFPCSYHEPMLAQCWSSVADAGPALNQHRLVIAAMPPLLTCILLPCMTSSRDLKGVHCYIRFR